MSGKGRWLAFAGLVAVLAVAAARFAWGEPDYGRVPVRSLQELEQQLESLRTHLRIPGLSAAIADGDRVIWAHGFGTANRERGLAARPDTIYGLASLTKPYASTIILQLVQEGRLSLDDDVSQFGIVIERSRPVRVRHLLSHTSGEPPGTRYQYDGNAFGTLTQIVERATGEPFARQLASRIIRPLALTRTAPNPGHPRSFWSLVVSAEVTPADVERSRAAFRESGADRRSIEARGGRHQPRGRG